MIRTALEMDSGTCINFEQLNGICKLVKTFKEKDELFVKSIDQFTGSYSKEYSTDESRHMKKTGFIPFPDILISQFDQLKIKCFMGIFKEINRVWITIDHRLYLWNYEDSQDFYLNDEFSQVIISVALVKPKKDIFVADVKNLLVVAMPSEIVILALKNINQKDFEVCTTGLSVLSDEVGILSIVGTEDGRIFMGGSDSNLYEFYYQLTDGWFSSRTRKINHSAHLFSYLVPGFMRWGRDAPIISLSYDQTRGYLYCLTDNNTIQVFRTKPDVVKHSVIDNIYTSFLRLCPQSLLLKNEDFRVISIYSIGSDESAHYMLMGLTSSGIRLYFGINKMNGAMGFSHNEDSLILMHTRLPYYNSSIKYSDIVKSFGVGSLNIHSSHYSQGVLVVAHYFNSEEDVVCQMDRNFSIYTSQKGQRGREGLEYENHSVSKIKGKIWSISEKKTYPNKHSEKEMDGFVHEYLDQHRVRQISFLILSNNGLYIFNKPRPIDVLNDSIMESRGVDHDYILDLVKMYGSDEFCTMLLFIIFGCLSIKSEVYSDNINASHVQNIHLWAIGLFFTHGKEISSNHEESASDVTSFSSKHNSLFIVLWRIIRRIWHVKINKIYESIFFHKLISEIQDDLSRLQGFIERHITNLTQKKDSPSKTTNVRLECESNNIKALVFFIKYFSQGLSLISMMVDHSLDDLFLRVSPIYKNSLEKITFEEALTTQSGYTLLIELLSVFMHREIERKNKIDTLIDVFTKRCSIFFSKKNLLYYKASEIFHGAKKLKTLGEIQSLAKEASGYLKESCCKDMSMSQIINVCEEYRLLCCHPFALEFCSHVWEIKLQDISTSSTEYEMLLQVIIGLIEDAECVSSDYKSVTNIKLVKEEAERIFDDTMKIVLSNTNVAFHHKIYELMVGKNWLDTLMNIETKFIESFLVEYHNKNNLNHDILWKYYVNKGRYIDSSNILFSLSNDPRISSLEKRIEYLTLSLANAKSSPNCEITKTSSLIQDIEDRMEVYNIQYKIYRHLERLFSGKRNEKAETMLEYLNSKFVSLSDLYNEFTHPFDLCEYSLEIIHCSQHINPNLVISLWTKIINKELNSTNDSVSAFNLIKCKILDLGRIFLPLEIAFPVTFICQYLEEICFKRSIDNGWVVSTLIEVGIQKSRVYESLYSLFSSRPNPFNTSDAMLYLLEDIYLLLKVYLDGRRESCATDRISQNEVKEFIARCVSINPSHRLVTLFGDMSSTISSLSFQKDPFSLQT